jgi:MinD superfamily P-loop ATPase
MKIAVASGKGGTGKTTVAASLAFSIASNGERLLFLDCDVEAPDAHLFLKPDLDMHQEISIPIPEVMNDLCSQCGKCIEVCQFHALVLLGKNWLVFPQLCHGCGSCIRNCPENAILEKDNPIGLLESGWVRDVIQFAHGKLTIGEPMPTPVIRRLKQWGASNNSQITILDAPPGASCSVVETLRGTDFVLLVTEPTPFGVHDLKQMIGIIREMRLPAGILVNRDGEGTDEVTSLCAGENIPILMRIPFDREFAAGIAQGKTLVEIRPGYEKLFYTLYWRIRQIVEAKTGYQN